MLFQGLFVMIMNSTYIPPQCCMQRNLLVGKLIFFLFLWFWYCNLWRTNIRSERLSFRRWISLQDAKWNDFILSECCPILLIDFDYRFHGDCFWNCLHWLLEDVKRLPSWKAYIIFNHICWLFGVSIMILDLSQQLSVLLTYRIWSGFEGLGWELLFYSGSPFSGWF